jgi:uncharacterized membrane protein
VGSDATAAQGVVVETTGRILAALLLVGVLVLAAALARTLWGVDLGPVNGLLDDLARVLPRQD